MNPQVRALTETKGNGPVLRWGKNTGGARETGPRIIKLRGTVSRPASRLLLPRQGAFFEQRPDASAGVAMMKRVAIASFPSNRHVPRRTGEPHEDDDRKASGRHRGRVLRAHGVPLQGLVEEGAVRLYPGRPSCRRTARRRRHPCADAEAARSREGRPHPRRHHHRARGQSCGTRAISFRRRAGPLPSGHAHQLQPRLSAARPSRQERPAPGHACRDRRRQAEAAAGRTLRRPRHRARPPLRRRGRRLPLRARRLWPAMQDCAAAMGVEAVILWEGEFGRGLRGGGDPPVAADSARKG